MSRILITSGPTRQYLDPVRYLTNASSGRMGAALAAAAVEAGHQVVIVSGPVDVAYPAARRSGAGRLDRGHAGRVSEGLSRLRRPDCRGRALRLSADRPWRRRRSARRASPLRLELVETPDIVAALAAVKTASQWMVAFALETEDQHLRAMQKLERKSCDLIVVNGPEAIHAADTRVEILGKDGQCWAVFPAARAVARDIFGVIQRQLIAPP